MSCQTTLSRFCLTKSISHRNSAMEMKVPDFVSTISGTTKCNHCSKLFGNRQALFYTVNKLKTLNCIVFIDVSAHKINYIILSFSKSQPWLYS